jgi:hypothetical protein
MNLRIGKPDRAGAYKVTRRFRTAFWRLMSLLLVMSVVLRALIPQGFMLDISDDAPLGFTITICSGLNGINAIEGLSSEHADHTQHTAHHGHEPGHEQENSQNMSASPCGIWTASTAQMSTAPVDHVHMFAWAVLWRLHLDSISASFSNSPHRPQQPRAPPFLLI